MEYANLNIRVDKAVKADAEAIASALGMNLTTAVNIFLRRMIACEGMPFDVRLNADAPTRQALADAREHRNLAGPFGTTQALMEALDSDDA